MKNKDDVIIFTGIMLLLIFIGFLFYGSYNRDKLNLIREDIINDSIIMEENKMIKSQDSILQINYSILKKTMNNHERRIRDLEKKVDWAK